MDKNDNLIPFVKGDPRINRKGRPKSFDALRKLAVQIAGEQAGETELTRVQLMLKAMASSKNPRDRELFLAYAYGKPRTEVDVTSGGDPIRFVVEMDEGKEDPPVPETI
jgi:hypothetical protein